MQFVLDCREKHLIELLQDDQVTIEQLDLGDFVIKFNDDVLLFERKTIKDMYQSIRDGRYQEQKSRLLSNYSNMKVFYIVEGSFDFDMSLNDEKYFGVTKSALVSSIISTLIRDNIGIFQTKNLEDTAALIKQLIMRVTKTPEKYFSPNDQHSKNHTVSSYVVKPKKSENISKKDTFHIQLASIPGISIKFAERIASHLNVQSYTQFVRKLDEISNSGDEKTFIKYMMNIDGIGKGTAKKLYDMTY